jgi:ATP-dependent Clp protease ATP-binding subunit ClpA
MFERFAPSARETVLGAREQARRRRHPHLGTEHLLLALLEPAAGGAPALLRDAGVDAARVRRDVDRLVGPGPRPLDAQDEAALRTIGIDLPAVLSHIEQLLGPEALTPTPSGSSRRRGWLRRREPSGALGPRVSPRFKKVLELSLREARALRDDSIAPEHLLLGLLREGDGLAARILTGADVDLRRLRSATLLALRPAA